MQNYFITTLYSITFLVLIDVFISKTNNGKAVQTVISLISVVVLVFPIVKIIKNFSITDYDRELDFDYSDYLVELEKDILLKSVESALRRNNIEFSNVELLYIDEDNKIVLKKVLIKPFNLVLNGSSEHIDMTERVILALKNVIDTGVCEVVIETD